MISVAQYYCYSYMIDAPVAYILRLYREQYRAVTLTVKISNNINKIDIMEEQLDDKLSIYSGSTNADITVSSGDEWDNDSDDSERFIHIQSADRMII